MTEQQKIILNLDDDIEILRTGVRRADIFMGVGLNAAENTPPISHLLATESIHVIDLVKKNLTPDEQTHVNLEFAKWIRANGLRELVETFAIFSDRLYIALFLMSQGTDARGEKLKPIVRFEKLGVTDKIDVMSKLIPVDDGDRRVLRSLNQARNCYAHRRGIVGKRDLNPGEQSMLLRWNGFRMEVREPDGNIISEAEMYEHVFQRGGEIDLRVVERTREFAVGAELVLEKQDLKEICLSLLCIGQRLLRQTMEVARAAGLLKEPVDDNLDVTAAI